MYQKLGYMTSMQRVTPTSMQRGLEYRSVPVSPVVGVVVPWREHLLFCFRAMVSIFRSWGGFWVGDPCYPCPPSSSYQLAFHRPSPAAAPPSASKPQINGRQNSVPLTVPCGADPPRLIIKVKEKWKEERREKRKRREEVNKEAWRGWNP